MKELAIAATKAIEGFRENQVIMAFVTNEALEKTAADIREKTGSGTTAKGVDLLRITNKRVSERVDHYINLGLAGCYMASLQ